MKEKGRVKDLLARRGVDLKTEVVLGAEVGSTIHGIAVADQDDLDMTIVRIENFYELVNGPAKQQSMMIRTQPDGHRSRMGDIDLNVYTLRKFAGLAAKGNPSILTALFSPNPWRGNFQWIDWDELIAFTASRRAGAAFLGYMKQQQERWAGKRGQKNVNRPELVDAYGFDTKYAGHVIRLGLQGIEYMQSGKITLPMSKTPAEAIKNLRTGGIDESDALMWAAEVEDELKAAVDSSTLPSHPNLYGVHGWTTRVYKEAYLK